MAKYAGYAQAQQHYAKLKEQFLAQLETNLLKGGKEELQQFKQRLEDELVESHLKEDSDSGRSAGQIVNQIFNELVEAFNADEDIQTWKQSALEILRDAGYKNKELTEEEKKKLNQALRAEINDTITVKLKKMLLKFLRKNTTGSSANAKNRYSAVLSSANTFLLTYLKASFSEAATYKIYGWPMKTLAGYINEDLAYRGLQKIFKDTNMHISPGGTRKGPGGKAIEMDNIISSVQSLSGLNQQLTITTDTDKFLEDYDSNLSQIKYFGEQVKSFSLTEIKAQNRERIANRADLRDAYVGSAQDLGLVKKVQYNRKFMSLYRNILTTFRPDTLFFTGKNQKMFMNDFIASFRKQGFLLQLEWDPKPNSKTIVTDKIILAYEKSRT